MTADTGAPAAGDELAVRRALGRALQARADEAARAVLDSWRPRFTPRGVPFEVLEQALMFTSTLGTALVGRYFETGNGVTADEARAIAERSARVVTNQVRMSESVRNYSVWRDATLRLMREEADRLQAGPALVAEATAVIRASGDVSLYRMAKLFDVQRHDLQRSLDAERAKLTHLALHDPLTGLANRTLLEDRLAHAIAGSARRAEQVGVLYLDLDGFKSINDTLGHAAGDQLLVTVAQRLVGLVRPSDTVARLGGDEFVVVCNDLLAGEAALASFAARVQEGVSAPVPGQGDLCVTVSVGAAIAGTGDLPQHVIARADAMMYDAKQSSRHTALATASLLDQAAAAARLASRLRRTAAAGA